MRMKINSINEEGIISSGLGFLKDRFTAEVMVFIEDDKDRYDPKQRAAMAMPGQPAIYIE